MHMPCTRSVHDPNTAVFAAVYTASHCVQGPSTRPYMIRTPPCTRPYTGHKHDCVHGPYTKAVYTPCSGHVRPCTRAINTAVVHGSCLRLVYTGHNHGRCTLAVITAVVHGPCLRPVYTAAYRVHGCVCSPCTLPCTTVYVP